jgi:hypothetical protein
LLLDFLDTAYACAYNDTDTQNVFFGKVKAAVTHSLLCGSHSKLRKAIHPLAFTLVNVFGYVKVSYLAPYLYRVRTGIERFYCRDAAFTLAQRSEKLISGLG